MIAHADTWPPQQLLDLLARLHRHKDRMYGDAWRKCGEVIAIFASLARKYDRLVLALTDDRDSRVESTADTVADRAVYAGHHLTWLAEAEPNTVDAASEPMSSSGCCARRGPAALKAVFGGLREWELAHGRQPPTDRTAAWNLLQSAFEGLETGLMAQADPATDTDTPLVVEAQDRTGGTITDAATWLLLSIGHNNPAAIQAIGDEVDRLERAHR